MKRTRYLVILFWILTCSATYASAQVSISIGTPNVNIGINLPLFPELTPVPGYPVYYAPRLDANYFFYDGMYWVYQNDNWYASSWYNGPWWIVQPEAVPLFILRIPVRYYRQPPVYFRGWAHNAPPRWGQHWGHGWEQHRKGWNHWKRSSVPSRAPLPVYQREYVGERYPRFEQQQTVRDRHYGYQPRNKAVREHYRRVEERRPEPPRRDREEPQMRSPRQQDIPRQRPQEHVPPAAVPPAQPSRRGGEVMERSTPAQSPSRQRGTEMHEQRQPQREQHSPGVQQREERSEGRGRSQEHQRDRDHGQGDRRGDGERGRGRD